MWVSLSLNASLDGSWGFTNPVAQIDSNSTGLAACNSVNYMYTGFMTVYCYAARLTQVATTGCLKSCSTTTTSDVLIGGQVRSVSPAQLIVHGSQGSQICSLPAPGYSGTITLQCKDGTLEVNSTSCSPDPCVLTEETTGLNHSNHSSSVSYSNNSNNTQVIPHGSTWLQDCSVMMPGYFGDVHMQCFAGQILANSSACAGPCDNATGAHAVLVGFNTSATTELHPASWEMAHGDFFPTLCSSLHQLYDGTINVSCSLGVLSANTSGCDLACPRLLKTYLTVTGVSHAVEAPSRMPTVQAKLSTAMFLGQSTQGTCHFNVTKAIFQSHSTLAVLHVEHEVTLVSLLRGRAVL